MTEADPVGAATPEAPSPAGNDSALTVAIAFGANLLIAVAKTVAAVLTGAASMVAEAAHSWADAGNEVFLLIAQRRAARPADRSHPFGYGRKSTSGRCSPPSACSPSGQACPSPTASRN